MPPAGRQQHNSAAGCLHICILLETAQRGKSLHLSHLSRYRNPKRASYIPFPNDRPLLLYHSIIQCLATKYSPPFCLFIRVLRCPSPDFYWSSPHTFPWTIRAKYCIQFKLIHLLRCILATTAQGIIFFSYMPMLQRWCKTLGKRTVQLHLQEKSQLTPYFKRQPGPCRKGFMWGGGWFQKNLSIITHLRWPQLNCKQWGKSRAPDAKWELCNRKDQIRSSLSYNGNASWQRYSGTDSGIVSFHCPYSLTANVCKKKPHSLTSIKCYLRFH